jgi:hypothetical protein
MVCRLEKQGRIERAIVCYQEAVADDSSQEAAKTKLELLKKILEKKVGNKWDAVGVLASVAAHFEVLSVCLFFFNAHVVHALLHWR